MYKRPKLLLGKLHLYHIILYFIFGSQVLSAVECGRIGFRFRGGIVPGLLTGRGETFIASCLLDPPVQSLGKLPPSKDLFKVPLYLAGEVTYTVFDNVSLFGEVSWRNAKSKPFSQTLKASTGQSSFDVRTNSANSIAGYVGIRLYGHSPWESIEPYVGIKMGILHNRSINGTISLNGNKIVQANIFPKNNVVSAGLQVGIDASITSYMKLIVQAEIVPTGAPTNNRNIKVNSTRSQLTSINVASIGTDLMLPFSIGLAYEF